MRQPSANCLMCDAPLTDLQRLQKATFCGEPCRWQHATLPPDRRCVICGRRLSHRESVARLCGSLECVHELGEPARERQRQEDAARKQRAGELRDRRARGVDLDEPETYWPTVLPANRRRITNLPVRRRRAFRDHLNRLITEAAESRASSPGQEVLPVVPAPSEPVVPGLPVVLGRACAVCQGYCCESGKNHAYLTVATIRRYMAQHPELRPRDVLAAYLSRVGNKTFSGSCVFHQAGGCNLPREMRGDMCNQWYCRGLIDFLHSPSSLEPPRAFFVSMSEDAVVSAAFCDEGMSRHVSVSPESETGGRR
jgi:hypothetical protein